MAEQHRKKDDRDWLYLAVLSLLMLASSSCSMLFPATSEVLGDDQEAFWLAVGADLEGLYESLFWLLGLIGL